MQWAMIEDKIVRVAKTEALAHLKPKLNGYRRYAERIYIGVTANPERRWQQHRPNGWSKMVLLYEAFRADIACELERELIDYAHNCNFRVAPENVNPGGEGISNEPRSNYVYVLVD